MNLHCRKALTQACRRYAASNYQRSYTFPRRRLPYPVQTPFLHGVSCLCQTARSIPIRISMLVHLWRVGHAGSKSIKCYCRCARETDTNRWGPDANARSKSAAVVKAQHKNLHRQAYPSIRYAESADQRTEKRPTYLLFVLVLTAPSSARR
ncbi:hypothetical protein BKA81DRAFT_359718 [Phyllosticta paracitricarpa]